MLALQLALMLSHDAGPVVTDPRIYNLAASSTPGNASTGVSATVTLFWQTGGITAEAVKVYRDNALLTSMSADTAQYTLTVDHYAEATEDTVRKFPFSWRFRVELYASDGALINTLELTWNQVYEKAGFIT